MQSQRDDFLPMESARISTRYDLRQIRRAMPDYQHSTVIAVQQLNLDRVKEMLNEVSDPFSANYGHHLSFEEVGKLVTNHEAVAHIRKFIQLHNMNLISESPRGEFFTISAPISKWEEVLNTEFFEFESESNSEAGPDQEKGKASIVRCLHYSLPKYLQGHVSAGKKIPIPIHFKIPIHSPTAVIY